MSQTKLRDGTDQTVYVVLRDANNDPVTSLAFNTASFNVGYFRPGGTGITAMTLVTQTANGAHADNGFVHIEDGLYRLDPADAVFDPGVTEVLFRFEHSTIKTEWLRVQLADFDPTLAPPTLQQIADAVADLLLVKGRSLRKLLSMMGSALLGRNTGTATAPALKSIDASETDTLIQSNGDRTTMTKDWTNA